MKPALKHALAAIILVLNLAAPVAAGPLEDADAARKSGDYATALRLLRPLADQGNASAQVNLGFLHANNATGVSPNYAEAQKWFRLAANQGNADAQYALGEMYRSGYGVPQNFVLAHMWYNLSAAQGDVVAAKYRNDMAKLMPPAQIAEAQKLAREWRPGN